MRSLAFATASLILTLGTALAQAPDGAIWMLEDANPGGLFRVTPK